MWLKRTPLSRSCFNIKFEFMSEISLLVKIGNYHLICNRNILDQGFNRWLNPQSHIIFSFTKKATESTNNFSDNQSIQRVFLHKKTNMLIVPLLICQSFWKPGNPCLLLSTLASNFINGKEYHIERNFDSFVLWNYRMWLKSMHRKFHPFGKWFVSQCLRCVYIRVYVLFFVQINIEVDIRIPNIAATMKTRYKRQ